MGDFDFPHCALSNSLLIFVVVQQNSRSQKIKLGKSIPQVEALIKTIKKNLMQQMNITYAMEFKMLLKARLLQLLHLRMVLLLLNLFLLPRQTRKLRQKWPRWPKQSIKSNISRRPCSFVECQLWFCHCLKFGVKNSFLRNEKLPQPSISVHPSYLNQQQK